MMQVKTFFIPTKGKLLTQTKLVEVPTGETKKGLFGGEKAVMRKEQQEVIVGTSGCDMDGFALVQDMHEVIDPWLEQGYELFSITAITSGGYHYERGSISGSMYNGSGSVSGNGSISYGYSYTEGIMVVLKKL